jgi:hypothetical protein
MVMDRMEGIPVSQIERLRESGVDIPRLAATGVEIFFTQVFRDGFFHADMHPGNILVRPGSQQYIALDFGIMGTLTEVDKQYLARNFLAFFRRDYKAVALAHLESGWVPADTRVDELEAAVRAVCEPVFDRPLKEISFGRVLLQLFQASRRFNVRNTAAAGPAAENPAQYRRARPPARPRPRPVENRQALPRALDEQADRLARAAQQPADRGAEVGGAAAAAATPGASGPESEPHGPD